ncbi:MAG: hypothetical protein JXR58_03585 [Bacteroidales bacterium]|nr:hypothetical protein [Bacteroidales bacterium]
MRLTIILLIAFALSGYSQELTLEKPESKPQYTKNIEASDASKKQVVIEKSEKELTGSGISRSKSKNFIPNIVNSQDRYIETKIELDKLIQEKENLASQNKDLSTIDKKIEQMKLELEKERAKYLKNRNNLKQ